ncbi:MAG TPA: hypothetical protein VLB84_13145 [Bacteroidia bacterium]|nr:hypothetical protein [Bacteroidia bacterium]
MRTKTINIYAFEELPKETKQAVIENFRNDPHLCQFALEDGIRSMKAYCDHFGVNLKDWQIGAYCRAYAITDADNYHFRGLKLKACDREFMPTGYCIDWDFFSVFYDEFKRTGDAKQAFEYGLGNGIRAIVKDCESCYEDEYIIETIEANEYEFLEDGSIA